jgi:hypothetical protein
MFRARSFIALALVAACLAPVSALAAVKPPEDPAKIQVAVAPEAVAAGGQVEVTVKVTPDTGIKINRYPKVSLKVAEVEGLVAAAETSVGDKTAPPPEKMKGNVFKTVDPLVLTLALSEDAKPGEHKITAKLKYTFCLTSDACFLKRETVRIPVTVR